MKSKLFVILLLLICASPVLAANVTYPQEYYTLGSWSDDVKSTFITSGHIITFDSGGTASIGSYFELRRQIILMEKQNELQAELIKAQWVETCYAPKAYVIGNYSAWESECANAGYTVG